MSYETNPITNRLKITKGWKNPHFPTQTLNYSREMLLWFKVYVFLKAYFSFQQIRLLACEIRISDKNTKILYLSVNKDRKEQKKNAKSKLKSKSFLYALKSPLTKVQTQDARFLLYQDFKSLKKLSSWTVNSYHKKILSKAWLTKNRNSSWVNTAYLIFQSRKKFKSRQQRYLKQKNLGRSQISQENKISTYLKSKKNNKTLKQSFWINKQRQIFSLFAKIQKEVLFVQKILNALSISQLDQKSLQLKSVLENLIAQYEKKKQILFKLKKLYNYSFHSNIQLQKANKIPVQLLQSHLSSKTYQKQTQAKLKFFWLNLKKELIALKKQSLFFQNKPHFFFIWKKKIWKSSRFCIPTNLKLRNTILSLYFFYGPKTKNLVQQLFSLNKKNSNWMKYMVRGFFLAQSGFKNRKSVFQAPINSRIDKFISKRASNLKPNEKAHFYHNRKFNFLMRTIWKEKSVNLTKTRIFTRKKKLFSWETLRLVRFNQKIPQKRSGILRTKKKQKTKYRRRKKTSLKGSGILRTKKKNKFKYRLPYRQEYKNQLKLFTNWRLKYLIQDFIQKYFAVRLYVKLLWPLAQFKNLKFYRIVFPRKRNAKNKRIFLGTKIRTKQIWLRKRYIFISQVTNHMRLKKTYKGKKKQRIFLKKIKKLLNIEKKKHGSRVLQSTTQETNFKVENQKEFKKTRNSLAFPLRKKFLTYKIAPNTWISKSPKKNAYLSRKLKMLQVQGQKRLHWAAKARFMSDLVTTLTLFAKYLDPQPLAEALAKVIGSTKKHVSALKLVETVLRTLNFKRGVGYRIGLTGRANGAEKSHVMYLRKLNRNRPRQTFSKNVNFAMAQARATIGTFGIKVWVFY